MASGFVVGAARSPECAVFRLPRESVVRAARGAIRQARREGVIVSRSLAAGLLRTAREAPEFAVGDWFVVGRCGCLVGNLISTRERLDLRNLTAAQVNRWVRRMPFVEGRVGILFDYRIRSAMSARQLARLHHAEFVRNCVVKVTE